MGGAHSEIVSIRRISAEIQIPQSAMNVQARAQATLEEYSFLILILSKSLRIIRAKKSVNALPIGGIASRIYIVCAGTTV